jgi:hypothetical protein
MADLILFLWFRERVDRDIVVCVQAQHPGRVCDRGLYGCFWDSECGECAGFACYVKLLWKTYLAPFFTQQIQNMKIN